MTKVQYARYRFGAEATKILETANEVLTRRRAQGYVLSVRQLYYQLVTVNAIPNSEKSYKNIVNIVGRGRMAGVLDWDSIEDRGRNLAANSHWSKPSDVIRTAAASYAIDKWADQPYYVEVMCEKDALSNVFWPVCSRFDVGFNANKGYSSLSAMRDCGLRMAAAVAKRRIPWILYFGDHDPSGLDMTRDVAERVGLFAGVEVKVRRMALNMDQVERYRPPNNPAKMKDARARDYVEQYGVSSWELDALEPSVLAAICTEALTTLRDQPTWEAAVEKEERGRRGLRRVAANYKKALDLLKGGRDAASNS